MHLFRKSLAALLVLTTVAQTAIPVFSAATYAKDTGTFVLTDSEGNQTIVDESWEEAYPTGTFAFSADQINLYEGATDGTETGSITLYRLGGTEGRAEAYVTLSPMVTQLDENTKGYAYAAGTKDYTVTVENPQPIAFYQPLGTPAGVVRSSSYAIAENTKLAKEDGSYPYYIMDLDEADVEDYQWQVLSGENWLDVDGATDALFYVTDDYYWSYDGVRCIFTVDGVSYCTIDDSGNVYEDGIEDELLEPMPEDFVNSTDKTYYDVEFDGNEYDMYTFAVIFADGEWEKEITFTALNDDLHENTEIVALQITEAKGAVLYDSAMTATVAIADDEAELPSQIGFATDVVYANKADGSVQIPLVREDGTQYIVGAVYQIADGTAVLGTDYAAVEGDNVTYFPADMTTSAIEVTLIDDGVTLEKDETGVYFTVTLTEVQGAAGSSIMAGKETCKVYLYNTSTEKPENGNIATELYSSEETDVGAGVLTTPALATMQDTIIAEAEEVPEDVVGTYDALFSTEVDKARSYDYGTLKFDTLAGDSSYWKDYTEFAHADKFNDYPTSENYISGSKAQELLDSLDGKMDDLEGYSTSLSNWKFEVSKDNTDDWGTYATNGRRYITYKSGYMQLTFNLPKGFVLNDLYSEMTMVYRAHAEKSSDMAKDSSTIKFEYAANKTKDILSASNDKTFRYTYDSESEIKLSDIQYVKFLSDYHSSGVANDAKSFVQLDLGYLKRRTMTAPKVVLHTADDDLIVKESDEVKDYIIGKIEPEISMVSGEGGMNGNGEFYVGSQVTVSRGNNASSYQFVTVSGSNYTYQKAVNFSATDNTSSPYTVASTTGNDATLELLKKEDTGDNTQINIYMDRVQEIVLDITPSVERTEEGAATIKTDADSIANAWKLVTDQTSTVSYDHKVAQKTNTTETSGLKFVDKKGDTLALSSFNQSSKSASAVQYSIQNVKNVRTINFGLSEDDCIVFNGETYPGNATITIPVSLYTSTSLVFYYYNKDYLAVDNTMVATITKIERYIDKNDNGMVDDEDIAMLSITEDSYSITELSPVKLESDGAYHQIILRTYYTLLPRNLFAPDDASKNDKAEVLPALVTTLTNTGGLSTEQQGYRYLAHKNAGEKEDPTGTGYVSMYGASGTVERHIDVALGGDFTPATYDGTTFTWNPTWTGKSYFGDTETQFEDPDPIYLDGTAVGDRYPVGAVDASGKLTSAGKTAVQNYLIGIHENDTISLCVRDTTVTTNARSGGKQVTGLESVSLAPFKTYPSTTSARNLTDPNADQNKDADFDSSGAASPMPEYNMTGEMAMPNLDISLSDYVSIATDGQEISITIGMPLLNMEKNREGQIAKQWKDAEVNGASESNADAVNAVKSVFNSLKSKATGNQNSSSSPAKMIKDSMNQYRTEMERSRTTAKSQYSKAIKVMGVEGSLALSISIVVKWDPIDTSFHFNQMLVVLTGSIQFSYTAYLTPCPIFYVSVTIAFEAELSLGLEAARKKVIAEEFKKESIGTITGGKNSKLVFSSGDWTYEKSDKLGSDDANETEDGDVFVGAPGATFTVTTTKKAIDIHFNGTLYVDAKDASGNAPEGFKAGTISSAGMEGGTATIKLAKSVDGKDNDKTYTVTFTVVDDGKTRLLQTKDEVTKLEVGYAMIDRVMTVSKNTTDVMFAGVSISPSLFMELAVGVGVELFKVELFANISVSCAFAIASTEAGEYDGDKNETQAFSFNEFNLAAALGFRVTALFFNFEFEAVKFVIGYDKEEATDDKSGWSFCWYAAGQKQGGGELRTASGDEDTPLTIRVILPGEGDNDNTLYTPEDNLISDKERAYTPTDTSVPFEYTAAFDSGDAFTLGEDLASGTFYKLITVGSDNYLVYTITDGISIHASQLVISKVQETVEDGYNGFGLVSPIGEGTYYKLDNDAYGDLDFDAWVVDDDTIRVAWVSYTADATDAYNAQVAAKDEIGAMAEAGKYTQVKSVTLTVGETVTAGNVEIVSDNADGHGLYYMVSGAGELVFYNEADYYTEDELKTYLADSRTYLGDSASYTEAGGYKYGTSDPTADFQMYYRELNARLYGKTGYPTYALRNEDGTYSITSRKSTEWEDNHVQMENAALTQIGDDYYAAYSTAYSKIDGTTDEMTYRKLYLQKIVVADSVMTIGDPVVLRSLVDSDKDSTKDGIYKNNALSVAYEDPYFANLNFLTGKLGALTGESEDFDEILALDSRTRDGEAAEASTFLLFEMNGETLVVPEASLTSITDTTADKRSGMIVPFFEKETADELNKANADENVYNVESAPVLGNVTFGVDGKGNITAVYTRSVRGTSSNALYMAKYDAENQTWGNGVMLAMRDMTTYENSIREDWDEETTKEAFYGGTNPAVFNFGKISVGIASSTDEKEEDRLLVITEGTLTALTTTTAMVPTYDANGNVSGMVAVEDEVVYEMATTTDGTYDTTNGIYALTFGAGKQALGLTSISLSNYDFTPGSSLYSSVAFTNVGDTTLRGSVNEPLQIELKMAYGAGTPETLATWKVTTSVASGQDVETELTQITLPAAGTKGDNPFADAYIYFTVSETKTDGTTGFTANTKAYDDNDKIVADAACIVLGDKAEVALEKCDIAVVDANDTTVTLSVDAYVTNRGSKEATGNTLSFNYNKTADDGSVTEAPLLGTSDLKLGDVEPISKTRDSSGISIDLNDLPSMNGQTVTGTITVSKDVFDTDYGTGSLNLVVSVEGATDEHNLINNTMEVAVEPTTLITAPAKISMQVGSTMRIPVTLRTTTETDPAVTVTELPVSGMESCMSVLYYDSVKGALVVMPGREGEGTIRIADTATNSILDICYAVKGEGEFINIFNDNGIFTWYVLDADGKLVEDDANDPKWEFADSLFKFPGTLSGVPYRNDLAVGEVGYAFTFQTFATKLDLYFMGETNNKDLPGEVKVSSDLEGFAEKTLSSSDATVAQTVDFDNEYNKAHTVTITVTKGKVRFDKLLEYFNEDMTIYSGKTAPLFTFSRDLPETASVKAGTEVPLAIYFIDNHGLTDAMLDGKSVLGDTNLTQISDTLWKYDLTKVWTTNGSHTIFIQNDSGMTTTRTITVEWFSGIDVDEEKKDALPGQINAALVDADGNAVLKAGTMDIYVKLTDASGKPIVDDGTNIVISHLEYLYDENGDPDSQYMQTYKPTDAAKASEGMYKLPATNGSNMPAEGVYRVTYTDPATGIASTVLVQLGAGETSSPKATIKVDKDGYILITASKTLQNSGDGKLDSAAVNGVVVAEGINSTTFSKKLDTPVAYNGVYTVTVTDQNGNSMTASTTVTQYPMVVPEKVLDAEPAKGYTDGVLNKNGTVTVDMSGIKGGQYDKDRSSGYTKLVPKYEVAIVNSLDELEDTAVLDWKTVEEGETSYTFENLAVGTYTVYIRDANDTDDCVTRTAEVKQYNVEVTGVQFTPSRDSEGGSITITAIGGMGDREYRLVDENGDPFLDKDGKELYGWQKDNTFTDLPDGEYYVQVRDTEYPEDNVVTYPDPDKGEGGITVDKLYSVKVITDEGGYVEINGVTVENGGMYYYLLGTRLVIESIPDKSNRTATLRINGEEVELTSEYFHEDETTAVIESLDQSYVIEAYFDKDYSGIMQALTYYESTGKYKVKHTITATVAGTATDEGGSISPEGKTIVYYGDKLTYTITPDSGYEIAMILVDGKRVDVADTYTFTETSRDRTIAVTFRAVETVAEKTGTAETAFTDVASSDWYAADVAYVYDAGLMIGTDEAHFSPSVAVNRAMLVTILWRMEGEVTANVHDTFTDVPVGQWYSEAVAWAAEKGLVNGYGDGTFGPMDALTREQILVILNRYAALKGIATETGTEAVDFVYSDWASSAVAWAQDKELLTGFGWDISDLTIAAGRAELAAFLRRYLQ